MLSQNDRLRLEIEIMIEEKIIKILTYIFYTIALLGMGFIIGLMWKIII